MLLFLLFGPGRVLCFAVWAAARAPPKQQKNEHAPAQTAKKMNTPPPLPSVFFVFCCLGRWACCFFCCLGGGRVFVFFCLGGGRVFFAVRAGACLCFCCLGGGGVYIFCCLGGGGGGRVFFFCCLGRGREFTHLPVFLARLQATQQQKRPNSKQKQHGFRLNPPSKALDPKP